MYKLNIKQKRFLEKLELDSNKFLALATGADYYKFYHIETGKEVVIRR